MPWIHVDSPVGRLKIVERDDAIVCVAWRTEADESADQTT